MSLRRSARLKRPVRFANLDSTDEAEDDDWEGAAKKDTPSEVSDSADPAASSESSSEVNGEAESESGSESIADDDDDEPPIPARRSTLERRRPGPKPGQGRLVKTVMPTNIPSNVDPRRTMPMYITMNPLLNDLLPPASVQSRSVLDARKSMSHASFVLHTFGSSVSDLRVYASGLARWGGQSMWPYRRARPIGTTADTPTRDRSLRLRQSKKNKDGQGGTGGLRRSGYYSRRQIRAEMASWAWWDEDGEAWFADGQRTQLLDPAVDDVDIFFPRNRSSQRIILGPADQARLFDIPPSGFVQLADGWRSSRDSGEEAIKNGWVLNAGGRIQVLGWAPNVTGKSQFLLVGVFDPTDPTVADTMLNHASSPAFVPQPAFASGLQVWQFDEVGQATGKLSQTQPRLAAVLCFGWGVARIARWCHVATPNPLGTTTDETIDLGLLGCVFTDGVTRVIRVEFPSRTADQPTAHVFFESAAVEIRPTGTVCTTMAWLSSRSIAIGCANGAVGVWSIPAVLRLRDRVRLEGCDPYVSRPLFMHQVMPTYIISLTSLHPHPNLLAATSMSGHTVLIDLSVPATAQSSIVTTAASTSRTRLTSRPLVFAPLDQCLLTVDENYAVRAHPVRRMHNELFLGRVGSVGNDIAASPVHPTVLIGTADGTVAAMPIAGRLAGLRRGGRVGGIWFAFQWRPPTKKSPEEQLSTDSNGKDDQADEDEDEDEDDPTNPANLASRPLARFVDGFVPEIVSATPVIPTPGGPATPGRGSLTSSINGRRKRPDPRPRQSRRRQVFGDEDDNEDGDVDVDVELDEDVEGDDDNELDGDDLDMDRDGDGKPNATNSGSFVFNRLGNAVFSTTYEAEAAVTRVGWHPGGWAGECVQPGRGIVSCPDGDCETSDVEEDEEVVGGEENKSFLAARFGGWAVGGTGNGLVRIEDLAVDY